jgi:hypothetical protein
MRAWSHPEGEVILSLHHAEQTDGSPRASIHFEVVDVDQNGRAAQAGGLRFCVRSA